MFGVVIDVPLPTDCRPYLPAAGVVGVLLLVKAYGWSARLCPGWAGRVFCRWGTHLGWAYLVGYALFVGQWFGWAEERWARGPNGDVMVGYAREDYESWVLPRSLPTIFGGLAAAIVVASMTGRTDRSP